MQLRQAELIRALDDNRVCRRNIDAGLDDGRTYEDVEPAPVEIEHHVLQLALGHLTVSNLDFGLRQQLFQLVRGSLDRTHVVVEKVNLAAASNFAQASFPYQFARALGD